MRLVAVTPEGQPVTVDRLSPRITRSEGTSNSPISLAEQERELIELHLRLPGESHPRRPEPGDQP